MLVPKRAAARARSSYARLLVAVAAGLVAACPPPSERPEVPAILRDVAMVREVDGVAEFTRPQVPPLRTTHDGRVGLMVESGPIRLYVLAPEKLTGPIVAGDPGDSILVSPEPYAGGLTLRPGGRGFSHQAICDVAPRFREPGERPNPYACGPGGRHDCYDVTHLGFTGQPAPGELGDLWGTPMTVEVADPKTPTARVVDVVLGEPVSTPLPGPVYFEPMVTADGRLLTGRRADTTDPVFHTWTNPETGETLTRIYDLMYAVTRPGFAPCDVRGWTAFHPVSHMPYDPELRGRYGVAAFPFRDGEGNLVPDGEEMGVTYPWLDRDGDNLFMTAVDSHLGRTPADLYPRRCVVEGCEEDYPEQAFNKTKGHAMVGLWTRGRIVHLDNLLNNVDWPIPLPPHGHRLVTLYDGPNGEPVEVRVGGARSNSWSGPIAQPPTFMGNTNILESIENLFNAHAHLKPVSPFDVVWVVSNDRATDEVVFDDYLDPDGFIVSSMQGSLSDEGRTLFGLVYHDGSNDPLNATFDDDVHLQNAATASPERWRVPPYGLVRAGTGRLEPVAIGGVKGKGYWLDGEHGVTYAIAEQPTDVRGRDWWISLFLDARAPDVAERTVLAFPDGSALAVRGRGEVVYTLDGVEQHAVALADTWPATGWVHLGLNVFRDGRVVLYVNGYAYDAWSAPARLFTLVPGALTVGAEAGGVRAGFRGWIDELKVFAHAMDPEVACNHALGTLVAVESNARWGDVAARYPGWAHAALASRIGSTQETFACYADYSADWAAHLGNLPEGTVGVRGAVHFPEGPIRYDVPRPDSLANAFCTSCHEAGAPHGLGLAALEPRAVVAQDDRRRQPLQPAARVHGNVPAGWIAPGPGPGGPERALTTDGAGIDVDRWVLP